jgi:tetratricopeptide (TPR) repeat protein
VLLSGEPGIGKSRILSRARKEFDSVAGNCLRFYCSPLHSQTALFPFLSHTKKAAALRAEDRDADKLAALVRFFEGMLPDPVEAAEDISEVLGVAAPSQRRASLSPLQRKEAAIKVFLDYTVALSRQQPLLIMLEDAHWIDPTSIELLDNMISNILDHRILLVVSARPEYQPVWTTHPSATLVLLSRIGWRNGAEMISGVAGGKTLPQELTEQILERSDGVPLFLEELTKTLLDSGWLEEFADGYKLQGPLPKVRLPNTLQDSLTSRLDRLGPVKSLAQIGSVIGREFSHDLLQSVTGLSDTDMDDALAQLIASGLIYRRGVAPEAVYFFKHALIQDAAYNTLLKSKRQQIHATIVDTVLEKFPGIAAMEPEVIAHHLTVAEDFVRAVDYWLIAGKAQIRTSAEREAVDHLMRGVSLLDQIGDAALRREADLKLQTALIGALVAVKGPFSPEVAECCERGLALATTDGISPMVFPFLYGQFTYTISTGKMRQAAEIAKKFIQLAEAANYTSGFVVGHRLLGMALLGLAEFPAARGALETALAAYVPERDDNVTFLFGQNVKVNSQTVLSLVLVCLGEDDAAKRIGHECLRTAEKLKHPHTTVISIASAGLWGNYLLGDIEEVHAQANRMVAISTEFGLQLFAIIGHFWVGWALYRKGEAAIGIGLMEKALAAFERANFKLTVPGYLSFLAAAKCETGQIAEARALCARSKAMAEECEELWLGPEIACVEAEIALRSDPPNIELARSSFDNAIQLARQFRAPGLEARCERARARLLVEGVELAS